MVLDPEILKARMRRCKSGRSVNDLQFHDEDVATRQDANRMCDGPSAQHLLST